MPNKTIRAPPAIRACLDSRSAKPGNCNGKSASLMEINVSLPSGRAEKLSVPEFSQVGDLKILAQKALRQGFLKLVHKGRVLTDPLQSLEDVDLKDGDHLTVIAQQAKLARTEGAFAVCCYAGDRLVTWGDLTYGGDSSGIQDQSKGVQEIASNVHAFAAILTDGSVVSWGGSGPYSSRNCGGDSSEVQEKLRNVKKVAATSQAFAAILADGSVVTWGEPTAGGDSSRVQGRLKNVKDIQATHSAFAALLADGSVASWGDPQRGGFSSFVQEKLQRVRCIQASYQAFAAILADG